MEMDQIPPAKPPKKEDDATDLDPIKIEGYERIMKRHRQTRLIDKRDTGTARG